MGNISPQSGKAGVINMDKTERIMLGEKPKIKFSNHYLKLGEMKNGATAKLLVCTQVKLEVMPYCFIEYDTAYPAIRENNKLDHYPLPKKGEYLLLGFVSDGMFFTTLRRSIPLKKKYYEGLVGREFEVVIGSD
jgi:hypothetical protein